MNKLSTILFVFLLAPLLSRGQDAPAARQVAATDYTFRFVADKDMFFVPWRGNAERLDSLLSALSESMEQLRRGERYICVSSYAASAGDGVSSSRMAYLRCQRVKSELITRGGITEAMFVTDRHIEMPYNDSLRNVVVVSFPASVEKVAEIAGAEAAARVEAYNREVSGEAARERLAAEQAEAARLAAEREAARRAEEERLAAERAEQERLEAEKAAAEQAAREQQEAARLAAEAEAAAKAKPYCFALRTNLLRWATLTPDLGVEWRISRHVGVAVNGTYTSWSWSDKDRRYALWEISPEVRWYLGAKKRGYVGAMFHAGAFNYKFSETGRMGDLVGGGLVGGYQLPVGRRLALDFSAGVGCTRADYDTYRVIDGVRVRQGSAVKNYWGVNHLTVGLVWTFGGNGLK